MNNNIIRQKRSPRGLVGVTTYSDPSALRFVPIGPNQWSIRGPDPKDFAREQLSKLKMIFEHELIARGNDPSQYKRLINEKAYADRDYWAARALDELADIDAYLPKIDAAADVESAQNLTYRLIAELVGVAATYHCWTIADNEIAIDGTVRARKGGATGAAAKAQSVLKRNKRLALDFKKRRANSNLSDSALKHKIGSEQEPKLGRSAAIAAVDHGLKILSFNQGKPDSQ